MTPSALRGQKNLAFGILAVWSWDWNRAMSDEPRRPRSAGTCSVQLNTVSLLSFLLPSRPPCYCRDLGGFSTVACEVRHHHFWGGLHGSQKGLCPQVHRKCICSDDGAPEGYHRRVAPEEGPFFVVRCCCFGHAFDSSLGLNRGGTNTHM